MWKFYILVWCILLTTSAFGQQIKPLTCTVKVIDPNSQPVSSAEVMCYEGFYDYGEGRKRWEVVGQARTDEEGRFSLNVKVINRNNVFVVAQKQELSLGWEGTAYESADLDFTIQLDKPTVLAGTVADKSGAGIAGAKVRVCLKNENMGGRPGVTFPVPESWFTTRTNDQGRFKFNNIPPGATADFWVEAQEKACIWTFWETDNSAGIQFDAGQTLGDINVTVSKGAILEVLTRNSQTNEPITGLSVTVSQKLIMADILVIGNQLLQINREKLFFEFQ
ncbi:MAG: carboxypeptidase regulatory-like domain-containing protein [Planctomycetes bacterium]|nr:carboxypeptidase regulatory-like domain-containing protein [Planctomycetota bacterium]